MRVLKPATFATAVLVLALSVSGNSTEAWNAAKPALTRLLGSDMSRRSEVRPHGVPRWYDWSSHPRVRALTPMLGFEAFTAWGQLYRCAHAPPSPNDAVDLRDLQSWALLRGSRRWRRLQLSSDLEGVAFAEDYAGPAVAARYVARGSGGTSVKLRTGYNFHFWPSSGRISLRASDVVAIVVTLRARLWPGWPLEQRPPCFVLSVGGDLWRSVSAQPGASNNGDVGIGRFKRVERDWRLFTMSTATPSLRRRFPLPLTAASDEMH